MGYNGRTIERSTDLPPLVAATKPGTTAPVDVWRDGAQRSVDVDVGKRVALLVRRDEARIFIPVTIG